eukprot:scaffold102284_cov48-Phaeocystis_antarctica.AAC.3
MRPLCARRVGAPLAQRALEAALVGERRRFRVPNAYDGGARVRAQTTLCRPAAGGGERQWNACSSCGNGLAGTHGRVVRGRACSRIATESK